jgi:hypothetical protein
MMIVAVILSIPSLAGAQTIRGAGARPCGEWSQARNGGGRDFEGEQWALGYVSAVTALGGAGRSVDEPALFAALDGYCGAHADEMLWVAVKAVLGASRGA